MAFFLINTADLSGEALVLRTSGFSRARAAFPREWRSHAEQKRFLLSTSGSRSGSGRSG
jgi:hypothetical protein